MERAYDVLGVRRTVQEIGIAERDMSSSRSHLLADIVQHCLLLHHSEMAVVHWHNRTMPAKMFASSARFGVGDEPRVAIRMQLRILVQTRKSESVRGGKC